MESLDTKRQKLVEKIQDKESLTKSLSQAIEKLDVESATSGLNPIQETIDLCVEKTTINNQNQSHKYSFRIVQTYTDSNNSEVLFQSRMTLLDRPCWRDDIFTFAQSNDKTAMQRLEIFQQSSDMNYLIHYDS